MPEALTPIRIPPERDWTTERDQQFVCDRLDDDYEEFDEILDRCFDSLRDLSAAMRTALSYFGANIEHRGDLTVVDLIDLVENAIRVRAPSQQYLERFTEHLSVCRFTNKEFYRVLGIYAADRDLKWLAPLADLDNWLTTATLNFEEAMVCEHQDFRRAQTTHFGPQVATPLEVAAAPAPLNPGEMREYQDLFAAWTQNSGAGAELMSPEQIARFSQLNDRVSAALQAA